MQISTTRLYAAAIAIVSGVYAVASVAFHLTQATMDVMAEMGWGGAIMVAIGAVVLIHAVVLLLPTARWLGRLSGPLMIVWGVIMLLNQWFLSMQTTMMPAMDPDWGMVALAALMVVSGGIMIARPMDMDRMP